MSYAFASGLRLLFVASLAHLRPLLILPRMTAFLSALFIFCMRIGDVSIGTMRVLMVVRGKRWIAALLGLFESGVWIVAISRIMKNVDNVPNVIGYATGFAAGTAVGITIEQWIGSGWVMVRVISKSRAPDLRDALRARGFGVTTICGEGRDGEVLILFVVAKRRRTEEVLRLVEELDPDAFTTIEPVADAIGGHVTSAISASALKK